MALPKSAQEIADVIGIEQALLLISRLPRAYHRDNRWPAAQNQTVILYVPTIPRLGARHKLVEILGWHDAIKMCKAFGGEILRPAECADYYRLERNRRILEMLASGMAPSAVAAEVGLTVEQIRRIRRENPREEPKAGNPDNADIDNDARA